MNYIRPRPWRLGLLGLAWCLAAGSSPAWERPPIKIDTRIEFQFDVRLGPDFRRPTAPWYAYFPCDPRTLPSPQLSPYPSWPGPLPPPGAPGAPGMLPPIPNHVQRPLPAPNPLRQTQAAAWPLSSGYAAPVQPVGYVPAQAPSYWYRNP